MKRLYYAGPLFTDAERVWNEANAERLRAALPQTELLVPQEFCAVHDATEPGGAVDRAAIFASCRDHLMSADAVLAVLDGADSDSGTAWEMGFAHARGTPIVGLRTDWRPAEDVVANAMLSRSCHVVCATLDEAVAALRPLAAATA
ncbi:MAG: nucleoside 2-deoxyribosyltransferase [Planctomycetota bacterium]